MGLRNLSFLMQPASIALIAPEPEHVLLASPVAKNILGAGFKGELMGVGAGCRSLDGILHYGKTPDLPHPPDLAVICGDPDRAPDLITALGELGAGAAIILAGEEGSGGIERCGELRVAAMEAAEPYPMRILGFSSLGVMVPGSALNASLAHLCPLPGGLAFVTQSGGVLCSVLDWATSRGIGFSHVISLGTLIDLDFGDMLDYLANDFGTQAILLHMEELTQVRKLMSAARLAARMKPVIVLKGGRHVERRRTSGRAAGQPGDSDAICDAAFRRAGMLRVHDIQELFDSVQTLARARSLPGDRLGILTNSGGIGILAADALVDQGGRVAELSPESRSRLSGLLPACLSVRNPLDLQADATGSLYARSIEILLEDRGIDAVLALHAPNGVSSGVEAARSIIESVKTGALKPKMSRLLTSWLGDGTVGEARRLFVESGVLTFATPDEAVRGLMQVVRFRRSQEMLMETPPSIPEAFVADTERVRHVVEHSLAQGKTWLGEIDCRNILDAYGIRAQGAVRHQRAGELLISVVPDPRFGPVICCGQGGSAAEIVGDRAFGLPPLNRLLARELLARTRVASLVGESEDRPGGRLESPELTLVKVSQLICDVAEIAELEINPLVFDDQGPVALKARIRIEEAAGSSADRLAIRPYPKELEQTIRIADGRSLLLRPIRPEDEPAYQELFAGLSPEDIFLRFMNPMKVLPHSLAARLTQLDYDREMALGLFDPGGSGGPRFCGGVRITADADNERAEFAILLRRDMTGLGLGPMMMRRILDYARKRGIREVYGEVLGENTPMLRLCKALGFSLKRMVEDPGVILATLRL